MTRTHPSPRPDDRGMSTPLSHVLSVAITTILIVALVASATGFLDTHKQRSLSNELETIGNRLAGELSRADALARSGDGVTVRTRHPDTVAGSSYAVQLNHGPGACGGLPTDTCLSLSASKYDVSAIVPVHNETDLQLSSGAGGRFVISSPGATGTAQADPRQLELSARVGVGREVGSGPNLGLGSSLSETPRVPTPPPFLVDPPNPRTNVSVDFDANPIVDPDGTIESYDWDWDDDGNYEEIDTGPPSPVVSHTFTNPGARRVTVRVTDNSGLTKAFSDTIHVGAFEYEKDLATAGANDRVSFTATNRYGQPIYVERISIDPYDDSVDLLAEDQPAGWFGEDGADLDDPPHEIEIDDGDDGSVDGYVDWEVDSFGDGLDVIDGGPIVVLEEDGDDRSGAVRVPAGNTTRFTFQDFDQDVDGTKFHLGIRYRVGSQIKWTRFNATVAP